MSETFADWYTEGKPLPVCHPIPECSATIHFTDDETLVWTVTNHRTGKSYTEKFTLSERDGVSEQELMGYEPGHSPE